MDLIQHTNSKYKYGALYRTDKSYIEFYQIIKQQFKVMIKGASVEYKLKSNLGNI